MPKKRVSFASIRWTVEDFLRFFPDFTAEEAYEFLMYHEKEIFQVMGETSLGRMQLLIRQGQIKEAQI